ncbi:RNA-binding protein 33 isoform X1 [Pelobates fuscus]|uniref:RNA-binding protein 33 isoform X1 n=1 Tax=Pelobates fuscus TaxID=191477 RepID=UPI002FE470E0
MAALLGDDDFDQFDKPGAERSRRRRTADDWDSELEDDLLEEDYLSGKKISPDLSDEELNDDLLQSDEEEQQQSYSTQGVLVSLNATAGEHPSFDLSKSMNEEPETEEPGYEEGDSEEIYDEPEIPTGDFVESYDENENDSELAAEHIEYVDEEADEVLDLEINEPLDEFQEEDNVQLYKKQEAEDEQHYAEDVMEETTEIQDMTNDTPEEGNVESQEFQELPSEIKEDSDEEDEEEEEEEECGRIRFKTERKEGTIIRLSDVTRERRNIPETLELSAEAKASLMEFEEMERQRKMGRYASRRGGRRGGNNTMHRVMVDHRHEIHERRNMRPQRPMQGQPIRSLFQQPQQQQIQPLLPMPRHRNPSTVSSSPQQNNQQDKQRGNALLNSPQQPKNIHINPHFKGNVAPVQVPLLPVPNQPRPPVAPPRFPGMPEFQHVPNPVQGNFNQHPRLQEPWRNPPPQPEREPFFIGEPRFPNHHMFDQRNPPPIPPPPLLNNHQVPNQNQMPFNQPGQGFNTPGPQPRFPQPQPNFNQSGPGTQQGFNQPGPPQPGFNQPGFNPPGPMPNFNQPGPQPGFNQPGPQPNFNQPGPQPGFNQPNFNQPGPQQGFNQPGPHSQFTQPGFNQPPGSGPQPGFNQSGPPPQPGFNQQGPGPQQGFNQPGFSRERPVRLNMPSPAPMGIPPFNQNSPNIRHFPPPRQPFPPGPGQQFIPPSQPNMQGPLQPPMQQMHQHHHLSGPPKLPVPMQQPQQQFRTHSQNQQTQSNRMQGQQRQGPPKPRPNAPGQNMGMVPNQQGQHARNSNLRELPIAQSQSLNMGKKRLESAPAAQVKPVGTTAPQARALNTRNPQTKPPNTFNKVKEVAKIEEQFPDEDEETRKYRLKIEEQKRLREEILKRKELRRQQQAGARKRELLERLSQQHQTAVPHQGQVEQEKPAVPSLNNSNQTMPQTIPQTRPNVKPRALTAKPDGLQAPLPQKISAIQSTTGPCAQIQGPRKKIVKQGVPNRIVTENITQNVQQVQPTVSGAPIGPKQTVKIASVQGKPQELRQAAAKRTVMQRSNSGSCDGPHIAPKVRVIKLSGPEGDNVLVPSPGNAQMPSTQQRTQVLPKPQFQQRLQQQQRQGPVRKVTLGKGSVQNPYLSQQYQGQPRQPHLQANSPIPHLVNSIQGLHQPNKVIMRGRGRGVAGQMGRGRSMPNKQNLRVVECKPQPCVVSVEGLSSSTTDLKLKNLLMSVGPIQSFQMLPHLRKAIATFKEPCHASAFQQKFHRHMIDLSHINVSLVGE